MYSCVIGRLRLTMFYLCAESGSSGEESEEERQAPRPTFIKPGSVQAKAPAPAVRSIRRWQWGIAHSHSQVSSEESSSEEESSEEEEPVTKPLYKPVFIAKYAVR